MGQLDQKITTSILTVTIPSGNHWLAIANSVHAGPFVRLAEAKGPFS